MIKSSLHAILLAVGMVAIPWVAGAANGFPRQQSPAPQPVVQLILDLKDQKKERQATIELRGRPYQEVIQPLVEALQTDSQFSNLPTARFTAYQILSQIGPRIEGIGIALSDPAQILQIRNGLDDSFPAIRQICAQAMTRLPASAHQTVVQWLLPLLSDEDPIVVLSAVRSLQDLGSAASSALPRLVGILGNPDEAARARWDALRIAFEDSVHEDIEVDVRQAAAEARIAIGGVGCDFALYPQLDPRGLEAYVRALIAAYPVVIGKTCAPNPTVLPPTSHLQIASILRTYVANVEKPIEFRLRALALIGAAAGVPQLPANVRLQLRDGVVTASQSTEPAIRAAALAALHKLNTAGH